MKNAGTLNNKKARYCHISDKVLTPLIELAYINSKEPFNCLKKTFVAGDPAV